MCPSITSTGPHSTDCTMQKLVKIQLLYIHFTAIYNNTLTWNLMILLQVKGNLPIAARYLNWIEPMLLKLSSQIWSLYELVKMRVITFPTLLRSVPWFTLTVHCNYYQSPLFFFFFFFKISLVMTHREQGKNGLATSAEANIHYWKRYFQVLAPDWIHSNTQMGK